MTEAAAWAAARVREEVRTVVLREGYHGGWWRRGESNDWCGHWSEREEVDSAHLVGALGASCAHVCGAEEWDLRWQADHSDPV